jgi:hypothetical protein
MRLRLALAAMVACATLALGADTGLLGTKITIREQPGRTPRGDLRCRDVAVALPAPGSVGDPSIAGIDIDVVVANGGGASVALPGGTGWSVKAASPPYYLYKNASAPQGGSPVRKLLLRAGKLVKLQMRGAAVGAASPSGGVDVRVTLATGDRLCASFPSATIVKDQPGTLVGKNAPAPADCGSTTTTTVVTTSTTTSTTVALQPCPPSGTCGGPCPAGACIMVPTFSNPSLSECLCVPPTVVPCGAAGGYPACGGACAFGETCAPFVFLPGPGNPFTFCACVDSNAVCNAASDCSPGLCPPGLVCGDESQVTPNLCGCTNPGPG